MSDRCPLGYLFFLSFQADPHRHERDEKPEIKGGLTIVDQGAERSQNRAAPGDGVKIVYPEDSKVKVGEGDVSKEEVESNRVIPKHNQPDKPNQDPVTASVQRPKPGKQVMQTI